MANVFAILSAIALAAAAFLAMKNKDAYVNEISLRKAEQDRLATQTAKHESLVTDFDETASTRKTTAEETVGLREKETDQTKKNKDVESTVSTKKTEADGNAAKITEIETQLKEVGNIEELVGKMERTKQVIEETTLAIATTEAKLADLTSEKSRTEGVIGTYTTKNSNYSNKRSFFPATRIGSIYPAYGFVTLPIGNTAGVVSGSTLDVVRDGSVIGKLRVRSVESGRAAAEIIPDSIAQDVTLSVGDRVVPGTEAK
jgi:vacuolar-type H+-ATPase subunit I/STV1